MEERKWKLSKNDPCTRSCSSSSLSQKKSSSSGGGAASMRRSSSQRTATGGNNFTRKCTNIAKEQKAKFYIVKRCIGMLLHWNKHRDSDS